MESRIPMGTRSTGWETLFQFLMFTFNFKGTMSPSGSGSPLMGSTDDDTDNTELEYSVFPR